MGRRAAKAAARAVLPSSVVIWSGRKTERRAAITFDDGPTESTKAYLDILDDYGAKATFFLVGKCCVEHQDALSEIVKRGHEIGGHGYTHRLFPKLTRRELERELVDTDALLAPNQPKRRLVRPPRGAASVRSLMTCTSLGYTTVLWSRDSGDWCNRDARGLVKEFAEEPIGPGEIVLFHEGQTWTLEALPKILSLFLEAGHELVTISELLCI
jgi:peptidoglycan/xylan/chitin deacetylase (PgdA/CDA1 family)